MMGFHGKWKYDGLTSLGIITLDTDCIPTEGVYVPLPEEEEEEPEVEIVYIDREVIVEKVLPAPDPVIITEETEVIVEVPVEVEKEVYIQEESNTMMIVMAVVAGLFVIMLMNLIFCYLCIRKHKKRVNVLEREKVNWGKAQKS